MTVRRWPLLLLLAGLVTGCGGHSTRVAPTLLTVSELPVTHGVTPTCTAIGRTLNVAVKSTPPSSTAGLSGDGCEWLGGFHGIVIVTRVVDPSEAVPGSVTTAASLFVDGCNFNGFVGTPAPLLVGARLHGPSCWLQPTDTLEVYEGNAIVQLEVAETAGGPRTAATTVAVAHRLGL